MNDTAIRAVPPERERNQPDVAQGEGVLDALKVDLLESVDEKGALHELREPLGNQRELEEDLSDGQVAKDEGLDLVGHFGEHFI